MENSTPIASPFGLHLMLDAYNCDPVVLDNADSVYKILNELPNEIGMHKMMPPYVIRAVGNDKKDPGGLSGFVIIEESHISMHTFVKRGFVTIDVYSCKIFDTEKTLAYFKKALKTEDLEVYIQERGKKYPNKNII